MKTIKFYPVLPLLLLIFCLYYDGTHLFRFGLISAVIHECGHYFSARMLKVKGKISFWLIAFKMEITETIPIKKENIILISGPLINILVGFVSFAICQKMPSISLYVFCVINFQLGLLNLLPISFFDGGRLLKNNMKISSKLPMFISNVTLSILTLLGFSIIFESGKVTFLVINFILFIIYTIYCSFKC